MLQFLAIPEQQLVRIRAEGEVRGEAYVTQLMTFLEEEPARLRLDFVYDLRRYEGGVTHDDLTELSRRLAERFGAIDSGGATTIIVSPDVGYRLWVPLMNVQFPHRRFVWVPDMASAEAELASARALRGISPAGPARSC